MLYSKKTVAAKRGSLRAMLEGDRIARFPGAFNPLSARLIERKGFEGVYVSGAVLSADLGLPDIGLTTLGEVAQRAGSVARVTDLPVLVDADTGFGETMNLARTVQTLEDAGVSGCHVEDQVNPKRCGHLDGKQVVSADVAVKRLRAAVHARRDPDFLLMARTDIRAVAGLPATLDRVRALEDAGADAIFPEAMRTLEEFEAVRAVTKLPILANMTEFGKSELFSVAQLESIGVNMVIWPVSLLRAAMGEAKRTLDTLVEHGHLRSRLTKMQHRAELYELLDYAGYSDFDENIYNFEVKK